MPLSKVQTDILRLLAAHRDPGGPRNGRDRQLIPASACGLGNEKPVPHFASDPDSYVAGACALNRHSREERAASAAVSDAQTLEAAGYAVSWLRREPAIYTAEVTREGGGTHLEWVVDSDFRFFPVMPDELFGYLLHPVDLAANKVMAAAGRRELRDIVDVVTVHETILPLGAVVWAAVEKSPGYTPEGLIAEIRRNSHYPLAEWRALLSTEPIDPQTVLGKLRAALDDAEAFVSRMPTANIGLLFLEAGHVVQPEPDRLDSYETHAGQARGHWPTSAHITAAILERYNKKPEGTS